MTRCRWRRSRVLPPSRMARRAAPGAAAHRPGADGAPPGEGPRTCGACAAAGEPQPGARGGAHAPARRRRPRTHPAEARPRRQAAAAPQRFGPGGPAGGGERLAPAGVAAPAAGPDRSRPGGGGERRRPPDPAAAALPGPVAGAQRGGPPAGDQPDRGRELPPQRGGQRDARQLAPGGPAGPGGGGAHLRPAAAPAGRPLRSQGHGGQPGLQGRGGRNRLHPRSGAQHPVPRCCARQRS